MDKIVFLDRSTMGPNVDLLKDQLDAEWTFYDQTHNSQIIDRLNGATIAIINKCPISKATLDALPDLKLICVAATGYDCVDVAACKERGVIVSNVVGYAKTTVPEHTFALIFALRRSLFGYREDVLNGEWQRAKQFCFHAHPIKDLRGSRLALFGSGAIGNAVAHIGRSLGMDVVFAARKGQAELRNNQIPFDQALRTADIISLHVPLNETTYHMISRLEFDQMEGSPILVNASRGGLIDETALILALDEKKVSAVGLDVLENEPPSPEDPILKIAHRPNVIVTPHVAWAASSAINTVWDETCKNICAYQSDVPRNVVT